MAEVAKVGSGNSFTNRSAKNLSASVDIVEDADVGEGNGGDDKTVEKSPFKKLSGSTEYLNSLRSDEMSLPNNPNHRWGSQLKAILE